MKLKHLELPTRREKIQLNKRPHLQPHFGKCRSSPVPTRIFSAQISVFHQASFRCFPSRSIHILWRWSSSHYTCSWPIGCYPSVAVPPGGGRLDSEPLHVDLERFIERISYEYVSIVLSYITLYYIILYYITLYYITSYYIVIYTYIYTHHVYTHNVGALLIRPLGSHDLVRFGHRKYLPASFQVELWRCSWWLWPSYGSLHFEMFSAYCTTLSSTIHILYTVYTYIHI